MGGDSPADSTPCRHKVYFTGRVQGVGFRYTADRVARQFDVTGFVRNLPDGRVELVAEGLSAELDRFIAAIAEAMAGCIDRAKTSQHPATGEFTGFSIRH